MPYDSVPGPKTLRKVFEILLKFLILMGKIIAPMYILLGLLKPEMPMFFSSLSYPTDSLCIPARAAYALPLVYNSATVWSDALFMATFFLGYVFSTLAAIHNLRFV